MAKSIKSYLVALGFQDNASRKLDNTLKKGSSKVTRFSKAFLKAGAAGAGMFAAAAVGVTKFMGRLVRADDELNKFAQSIGKSKEEARKMKTALDAMGKTMDEVAASPELTRTFQRLQQDAEKLQPPNFSEGLNQIRAIGVEFTRMRQAGAYAVQWIGSNLVKHLQRPMEKFQGVLSGVNDTIIRNIPKWSAAIGKAMAVVMNVAMTVITGFVKLATTVVRFAETVFDAIIKLAVFVFNALKLVFDAIPHQVKIAGAAIGALAMFIIAGPIGKLVMILMAAMLLLDDFYTYLDGGDALLGGVWKTLINIWNLFRDSGAIEQIKGLFDAIGKLLIEILRPLGEMGGKLGVVGEKGGNAFAGAAKAGLEWLITVGLPAYIAHLTRMVTVVTNVVALPLN